VRNPAPLVTQLTPDGAPVGGPAVTVTADGTGVTAGSRIVLDGMSLSTTYVSTAQLTAVVPADQLTSHGTHTMVVTSPPPGGGSSAAHAFSVRAVLPVLTTVSPDSVPRDAAFSLTVTGAGFTTGSVVHWNGQPRPTTWLTAGTLTAAIPGTDVAADQRAAVTVATAPPGGGVSNVRFVTVGSPGSATPGLLAMDSLALVTNDLVADPVRDLLYVSVPSSAGPDGNSVKVIDPGTGTVVATIPVGSEPNRMAISNDGQFLYVGLDGAASIRRVTLATQTADLQFVAKGVTWTVGLLAGDLVVPPGRPRTVVVSIRNPNSSPSLAGVVVFEDGVPLPREGAGHTGADAIEPGLDSVRVYGYNTNTTEFGFRRMAIAADGIYEVDVRGALISDFWVDIVAGGGRVYATNGVVLDPEAGQVLGTIGAGPVIPDPARGRAYVLRPGEIRAYALDTFTTVDAVAVPGTAGASGRLARWGEDGFAWRNGARVYLARTDLVQR
jgi:YVTN family beta-propeller protein